MAYTKKLTPKQKKLQNDIEYIRKIAYGYDILINTFELERERYELIRNRILSDCVLTEEAMSIIIMSKILKDSKKWKTIKYFGKIKRFLIFNDDILAHISPFKKLETLCKFINLPEGFRGILTQLFSLRNTFAHYYTIDYTKERKAYYNKKSVFDMKTFEKYCEDVNKVERYLIKRVNLPSD